MITVDEKVGNEVVIKFESETERDQIMVVMEALAIFGVKNEQYHDGWRAYGLYGAGFFVKDRANRIWRKVKRDKQFNIEDALDLINLCAFAIRSQREGNVGGEYWEQEDF